MRERSKGSRKITGLLKDRQNYVKKWREQLLIKQKKLRKERNGIKDGKNLRENDLELLKNKKGVLKNDKEPQKMGKSRKK